MKPSNHYSQPLQNLQQASGPTGGVSVEAVGRACWSKRRKCSQRRSKGCRRQLTVDKYRRGTLTTVGGDHHEGCSDMSELPVWRRFPQTPRSARGEEEGAVMALPGSRGCW